MGAIGGLSSIQSIKYSAGILVSSAQNFLTRNDLTYTVAWGHFTRRPGLAAGLEPETSISGHAEAFGSM